MFFQFFLFNFFHIIIRTDQLRQQNAHERNLRRILVAENTILDSEERNKRR